MRGFAAVLRAVLTLVLTATAFAAPALQGPSTPATDYLVGPQSVGGIWPRAPLEAQHQVQPRALASPPAASRTPQR